MMISDQENNDSPPVNQERVAKVEALSQNLSSEFSAASSSRIGSATTAIDPYFNSSQSENNDATQEDQAQDQTSNLGLFGHEESELSYPTERNSHFDSLNSFNGSNLFGNSFNSQRSFHSQRGAKRGKRRSRGGGHGKRSSIPGQPGYFPDHRIVTEDQYEYSINEKGTEKSRILVRDANDPSLGRLYSIHTANSTPFRTVYYCRGCIPGKCVPVSVYANGEVREAPYDRHFPKCVPTNFDDLVAKQELLAQKFELGFNPTQPIPRFARATSEFPTNNQTRAPRSRTGLNALLTSPEKSKARSRSRSPLTKTTTTTTPSSIFGIPGLTSTPLNKTTSSSAAAAANGPPGSSASSKCGRRPNIENMEIIRDGYWRMKSVDEISPNSKLWILSSIEKKLGRQFAFSFDYQDGYLFGCLNCKRLTTNGQKAKAFVQPCENGKIIVREGKHYATCKPFPLTGVPETMNSNGGGISKPRSSNAFDSRPQNSNAIDESLRRSPRKGVPESPNAGPNVFRKETAPSPQKTPTPAPSQPIHHRQAESNDSFAKRATINPIPIPIPAAGNPRVENNPNLLQLNPQVLDDKSIVYYCHPWPGYLFSTFNKLNLTAATAPLWRSIGGIFELKSTYKPIRNQLVQTGNDSFFKSLSLLLTDNEEGYRNIKGTVKSYFYDNYKPGATLQGGAILTENLFKQTLIGDDEFTNLHISVCCQLLNLRIGVFNDAGKFEMYGNWEDYDIPSILLQKANNKFQPVLMLQK